MGTGRLSKTVHLLGGGLYPFTLRPA